MNLFEIAQAAREALNALAIFPLHWVLIFIVFIVFVEGLMFIPYVGFIVKLSLAGLLGPQLFVLLKGASAGRAPRIEELVGAFNLPFTSQIVLIAIALIPFLAGIAYLVFTGNGASSVAFFFGNILKTKPPSNERFNAFKNVMYVVAIPFTFITAAVVLYGLSGWNAIALGFALGVRNVVALAIVLLMCLAFEWAIGNLPSRLPRAVGTVLSMVLLVAFFAWSSAFTYTLSVHAFSALSSTPI